jgi:hypothetical protein
VADLRRRIIAVDRRASLTVALWTATPRSSRARLPLSRAQFDQGCGPPGHLMVETPDEAVAKNLAQHEVFPHDRTLMQMSVSDQPRAAILRSIELLGMVVTPKVRSELAIDASSRHHS